MNHCNKRLFGARTLPAIGLVLGLLAGVPATALARTQPTIEGVWRVTRSGVSCQDGTVFRSFGALMTFTRDGLVIGSAVSPFGFAGRSSIEHGTWSREPAGHYSFRLLSYDYDAGQGGAITGSTEVTGLAVVGDGGTTLAYNASIQFFDAAGNALNPPGSVCGQAGGTRFR